jgi:AAA domain-containing protein
MLNALFAVLIVRRPWMALKRGTVSDTRLERVLIYGDPKSGKTRLATSLPSEFGEAIYVAWDPGTEHLGPVLEAHRPRLHVIQSVPDGKTAYSPDVDAFAIALHDWRGEYPNVRTLIWDHITATAEDCLFAVADSGQFSDKHIRIGDPKSAGKLNVPMEGDYGAIHSTIDRLTTYLFRQPLHLIILAHATMTEAKDGSGLIGGPATVGRASVRKYAGRFDTVVHIARKHRDKAERFVAFTDRHDNLWNAGVRSSLLTNPMPSFELAPDPINFWLAYQKNFSLAPQPARV